MQQVVDRTIGEDALLQFRDDFENLMYQNNTKLDHWNEDKQVLKKQAQDGRDAARSTEWNRWAIGLGVLSLIVGLYGSFGTVFSAVSLGCSLIGVLHKITVDTLAFDHPYKEHRKQKLKFMSAWNRGAMNSWKAVIILPLGVFVRYTPQSYRIGVKFLDVLLDERY